MNVDSNVTFAVKCFRLVHKFTYHKELFKMVLKSEAQYASVSKCSAS